MNPALIYIFQILVNSGMPPQQAWQQAQQYAAQMQAGGGLGGAGFGGAGGGLAAGGGGLLSALAMLLGGTSALGATAAPYNLQMQAAKTGLNPSAMASGINQLARPLSKNLISSVSRAAAPGIEGAGLATSPGMSEYITAQALAPYELQEQQLGESAYLAGQRQPFGVGSGIAGEYPAALAELPYLMTQIAQQV